MFCYFKMPIIVYRSLSVVGKPPNEENDDTGSVQKFIHTYTKEVAISAN